MHKQNKLVRQRACTIRYVLALISPVRAGTVGAHRHFGALPSFFEISALPDTNYELPTTDTELAIYQSTTDLDNTFFAAFFLLLF